MNLFIYIFQRFKNCLSPINIQKNKKALERPAKNYTDVCTKITSSTFTGR